MLSNYGTWLEMCSNLEGGERKSDEAELFATYLSELKERGSAVLVVGELPRDGYSPFCKNMLGDPSSGPRCRLRVSTHEDPASAQDHNPISTSSSQVPTRHIISTFNARGEAKASTVAMGNDTVTHVERGSLSHLGIAISREIQKFREQRGEFQPAELRVCFDSLRPLLEECDEEQVFKFLDILINRIRSTSGMGHFHLPIDPDDCLVHTFADIFDAMVKLDTQNGQLVQYWRVQDRDLTSGWTSV